MNLQHHVGVAGNQFKLEHRCMSASCQCASWFEQTIHSMAASPCEGRYRLRLKGV
jgi:hypothetical protein